MMTEKKLTTVTLTQISEALEERQKPDRRTRNQGIPEEVNKERRKESRRMSKTKDK